MKAIVAAVLGVSILFAYACDSSYYSDEISYFGPIEGIEEQYNDGRFYHEHIYTFILSERGVQIEALNSTVTNFSIPVNWDANLVSCSLDELKRSSRSDGGFFIIQGRPSQNRVNFHPSFIAVQSNFEILNTCGDPIEFINFTGAERYYRENINDFD